MKLHEGIKVCDRCKGKGSIERTSHDCWGVVEWDEITCYKCKGYGFTIPKEVVDKIKKELMIWTR